MQQHLCKRDRKPRWTKYTLCGELSAKIGETNLLNTDYCRSYHFDCICKKCAKKTVELKLVPKQKEEELPSIYSIKWYSIKW